MTHKEIIAACEQLMSDLMDAQCSYNMGGLGGCRPFNIEDFDEGRREFILRYITTSESAMSVNYHYIKSLEE